MKLREYPPQEPLSEAGEAYGAECWRRFASVAVEEFAFGPDPYQRLLVAKAGRPDGRVLLFWHGGGWTSGYKEWMAFMAPPFNASGVTFVSAGYRLAPVPIDNGGWVWAFAYAGVLDGEVVVPSRGGTLARLQRGAVPDMLNMVDYYERQSNRQRYVALNWSKYNLEHRNL